MSWIEEMEMFVTAEEPGLGDVETLQAQLLESNVSSCSLCDYSSVLERLKSVYFKQKGFLLLSAGFTPKIIL